jgi:hypothetical protein
MHLIIISKEKEYKYKDERIALTKSVVESIKSIKCFVWEKVFEKKILSIRNDETFYLKI